MQKSKVYAVEDTGKSRYYIWIMLLRIQRSAVYAAGNTKKQELQMNNAVKDTEE
jgi:hypothetical protein